jgi:hypothetical protein
MASLAEQIEAVLKVSPGGKTTGDIARLVKPTGTTGRSHTHSNMVLQALHMLLKNGKVSHQHGIWNLKADPVEPAPAPVKPSRYRSIDDD